jgi:hypothetical protein
MPPLLSKFAVAFVPALFFFLVTIRWLVILGYLVVAFVFLVVGCLFGSYFWLYNFVLRGPFCTLTKIKMITAPL